MNDVGHVHNQKIASPPDMSPAPPKRPTQRLAGQPTPIDADRVEFSDAALSADVQASSAQEAELRIAEIQARIADGTYLTPDKLAVAIEGLYQDLTRDL